MFFAINTLTWLVCFIPVFLIVGPAVANIGIVLVNVVFLFIIFYNKEFFVFKNKFFIFFISLCLLFVCSSIFSDNIYHSLSSSLFYFRYGILSLAIIYLSKNSNYFPKLFLGILSSVFIFLIFDSFFQYFSGFNILGYEYHGYRLSSVFGEEKILGSFFSRLFPIFFGLIILVFNKSLIPIILGLSTLVLIDVLIFLSGERTAFFYLILFSILVVLLLKDWRYIRLFSLCLSIIIMIVLVNIQPNLKHRMFTQTLNQTQLLEEEKRFFSNEHENIYKIGLDIFIKNPILGIGPKNFRIECTNEIYKNIDGCRSHPHNTYIQLLSETGILGFISLLAFFIYISYNLLKQFYYTYFLRSAYMSNFTVCFALAVFINLWPLIPTGNFFSSYINIFYYLSFGFYFATFKNRKN